MKSHTIAVAAKHASRKTKKSSHQCQDGNQQDTRKNPHAIDVGSGLDIQHSYRYFISMAICTTLTPGISKLSV
jgi:hypothetical protein